MATKMFRFTASRYLNPTKILSATVYQKDGSTRVAVKLDAKDPSESVVYTDPFPGDQEAHNFILSLPVQE